MKSNLTKEIEDDIDHSRIDEYEGWEGAWNIVHKLLRLSKKIDDLKKEIEEKT